MTVPPTPSYVEAVIISIAGCSASHRTTDQETRVQTSALHHASTKLDMRLARFLQLKRRARSLRAARHIVCTQKPICGIITASHLWMCANQLTVMLMDSGCHADVVVYRM